MKILGIDFKPPYKYDYWDMYVDSNNYEIQKEFTKTYFIEDKNTRLTKVRGLIQEYKKELQSRKVVENEEINKTFGGYNEYSKAVSEKGSLFENIWVELSNKRRLELECYVLNLFVKADEIVNKSCVYDAIEYLIDEQFKIHKGVVDEPETDIIYRAEYNRIICELINKKIAEINKIPITELPEQIQNVINRGLSWNAQKNIIGTIFGLLYKANAIKGTKEDLSKGLCAMFPNLSISTIKDNLNLKINTSESKTLYDTETEKLLIDFIKYVKSTTN